MAANHLGESAPNHVNDFRFECTVSPSSTIPKRRDLWRLSRRPAPSGTVVACCSGPRTALHFRRPRCRLACRSRGTVRRSGDTPRLRVGPTPQRPSRRSLCAGRSRFCDSICGPRVRIRFLPDRHRVRISHPAIHWYGNGRFGVRLCARICYCFGWVIIAEFHLLGS